MQQTLTSAPSAPVGLTTGHAPFVEEARSRGELYIEQKYELYTDENHEAWRRLYARIRERWERYANPYFLKGVESLRLPANHVPKLSEVNLRLQPLTGFQAKAVSGYVPSYLFFDCLRRREFPARRQRLCRRTAPHNRPRSCIRIHPYPPPWWRRR